MRKNILITGGSSEIGYSILKKLEKDNNIFIIKHQTEINVDEFSNNPQIF